MRSDGGLLFQSVLLGIGFGLSLLFEPVAVTADVDDGAAMQEAVESRRSHNAVTSKDMAPVGEGLVAGEDDGLLHLVAFADGLEQKTPNARFRSAIRDPVL